MSNTPELKSTVAEVGRYVTQIIHFTSGNKRTITGIDTHTIKQGQMTKFYTKDGRMIMVNDINVELIEIFNEDE
jgi:hypothetical protein